MNGFRRFSKLINAHLLISYNLIIDITRIKNQIHCYLSIIATQATLNNRKPLILTNS